MTGVPLGRRVRYVAEYGAVRAAMLVARILPGRAIRGLGASLGLLFYLFDGRHRRIALANVAAAFPRKPEAERRALVRRVFGHFGHVLFDLMRCASLSR